MPITPVATYRIQLGPTFGFAEVTALLPQLADLGISHLYLSPIGTATAGSTHGYDWIPPGSVAACLGGVDGLRTLRRAAAAAHIGIIVDIVPNHMGVADPAQNPWWNDVLRHGPRSQYATYFDLDFATANGVGGRLALPVLGADADLSALRLDGDTLVWHGARYPTAPGTATDPNPIVVHDRQHYRFVPHNSGHCGYRRFGSVTELAALRQENPEVYYATHQWILDLAADDLIDGVRVDHVDGLADPVEYLRQLRADLGPDALIFIEKMLAPDEELDSSLPVEGTTGYSQLRAVDALFVSEAGIVELTELHEMLTGDPGDAPSLRTAAIAAEQLALRTDFRADADRLSRAVTAASPHLGLPRSTLDAALAEVIGASDFARYDYPALQPYFAALLASITADRPDLDTAIAVIADATSGRGEAAARLAQTTAAVSAAAVENRLFYRTARLVSTQELGGDPGRPTVSLEAFHALNVRRAAIWPGAMSASSTHDTKRGEDVRARIRMLSQIPQRWMRSVMDINRRHRAPDPVTGLFLLQNIFGVWPTSGEPDDQWRDRVQAFARKAIREAGRYTSWTAVNREYETAVARWVDDATVGESAATLSALVAEVETHSRAEALAAKALTLLGPGLPDIYQGTQWWEDSLVDPDNRRAVDYTQPLRHPKYELVSAALAVRRAHHRAFGVESGYLPVYAEGPGSDRVIAFGRARPRMARPEVIVVTARFTHLFTEDARRATILQLPAGNWADAQSGLQWSEAVSIADLLAAGPVAILVVLRTAD